MKTVDYGATTGMWLNAGDSSLPQQYVVARKDHHTWTYRGGQLIQGICIPGITLYQQTTTSGAVAGVPRGLAATDDLSTPDPTAALYSKDPGTDWSLVGWTFVAALTVVGGFVAGLKFAGRAAA
jgi:hypothetical protein